MVKIVYTQLLSRVKNANLPFLDFQSELLQLRKDKQQQTQSNTTNCSTTSFLFTYKLLSSLITSTLFVTAKEIDRL